MGELLFSLVTGHKTSDINSLHFRDIVTFTHINFTYHSIKYSTLTPWDEVLSVELCLLGPRSYLVLHGITSRLESDRSLYSVGRIWSYLSGEPVYPTGRRVYHGLLERWTLNVGPYRGKLQHGPTKHTGYRLPDSLLCSEASNPTSSHVGDRPPWESKRTQERQSLVDRVPFGKTLDRIPLRSNPSLTTEDSPWYSHSNLHLGRGSHLGRRGSLSNWRCSRLWDSSSVERTGQDLGTWEPLTLYYLLIVKVDDSKWQ